jgi:hypothetical protein
MLFAGNVPFGPKIGIGLALLPGPPGSGSRSRLKHVAGQRPLAHTVLQRLNLDGQPW